MAHRHMRRDTGGGKPADYTECTLNATRCWTLEGIVVCASVGQDESNPENCFKCVCPHFEVTKHGSSLCQQGLRRTQHHGDSIDCAHCGLTVFYCLRHCRRYGLVRAVDGAKGMLYILTDLPPHMVRARARHGHRRIDR
eukprot:5639017-Pyramimonas_sp.AAC.1